MIGQTGLSVISDIDEGLGPIRAEEGRVHQVVMNLVTNAVQAVGEKVREWLVANGYDDTERRFRGLIRWGCYNHPIGLATHDVMSSMTGPDEPLEPGRELRDALREPAVQPAAAEDVVAELVGAQVRPAREAAEILDDDVRAVICPDKVDSAGWEAVMEAAAAVGLRATNPAEVESVLAEGLSIPKPVIMDFIVEKEEGVYPMVPAGAAITEMLLV